MNANQKRLGWVMPVFICSFGFIGLIYLLHSAQVNGFPMENKKIRKQQFNTRTHLKVPHHPFPNVSRA